MTLLPKSTYKFDIKIGLNSQQPSSHTCPLDKIAGHILINEATLTGEWLSNIKKEQLPSLCIKTWGPIWLDGTIPLFVKIREI